jgi:hypothetical protein
MLESAQILVATDRRHGVGADFAAFALGSVMNMRFSEASEFASARIVERVSLAPTVRPNQ